MEDKPPAKVHSRTRKTINFLAQIVVLSLALMTVLCFKASSDQLFYLVDCCRFQFFVAQLLLIGGLVFLRSNVLLAICALSLIPNALAIAPYFTHPDIGPVANRPVLRIYIANVWCGNRNFTPFLEQIRTAKPDVIMIQELSPEWSAMMAKDLPQYQAVIEKTDHTPWGMGTYTTLPARGEMIFPPNFQNPTIKARVRWNNRDVDLINCHALPITRSLAWPRHKVQMTWLERYLSGNYRPIIVGGDFNETIWSPGLAQLQSHCQLRSAASGLGWKPTWPKNLDQFHQQGAVNNFGLAMLPIDHCLVSKEIHIVRYEVEPNIESDHCPLLVDISLMN